jgi:hypothetical protein
MRDLTTAASLSERTEMNESRFRVLVEVNRWLVAGALSVGVFGAFMLWGVLKPVPLHTTMQSSDMVETVFAGLVGAIITSTTLVVSINQLVLSQEIGSLGNQRSRMDITMDFRQQTDDLLGMTTPADPADYLDALVETTECRAIALRELLSGTDRRELGETIDTYVDDLLADAQYARDRLADAEFGTFEVISPALDYNYSRKMHDLRWLERRYEADLTGEERRAIRDLLESLTMYGPVREYIKGLYIQWALVKLSRAILYSAVVALTVAGGMVVFVDATTVTGTFLGVESVLWVVSAAFATSTLPFLVFTAYILRLATLAKQTLTMGPLVLR